MPMYEVALNLRLDAEHPQDAARRVVVKGGRVMSFTVFELTDGPYPDYALYNEVTELDEAPEDHEEEAPAETPEPATVTPLDPDIPYIGTLRKAGVTMDEVAAHAKAGTLTEIKGIGESGALKIAQYLELEPEEPAQEAPTEAPAAAEATLEEVKDVLTTLAGVGGLKAVKQAIAAGGAEVLAEVPESSYGAVVAKAQELMG